MTAFPTRPQAVPEYRNALVDDDELWSALAQMSTVTDRRDFEHPDQIRSDLADAQLWWIGAEITDLVMAAAPSMPPATLTRELVPDAAGFVVFEHPIRGTDADHPDVEILVHAYQWFPTIVQGHPSLSILTWHHLDEAHRAYPLGRADWLDGTLTDDPLPEPVAASTHASLVEDRRSLAALWQLASQASIAETVDRPPDRPTQKRLQRARRSVPEVRLVNLASHHRAAASHAGQGDRTYTRRWIVEGHWRQQACGPQWSQRRPVYIAPHAKGPEGAPLVVPDAVKVWR